MDILKYLVWITVMEAVSKARLNLWKVFLKILNGAIYRREMKMYLR
nr:MAG TPA: hypothetical protein [Caudoviricetes sp.]